VVDMDATLITAHSDKLGAAPTYKRGFGFHPLLAYFDLPPPIDTSDQPFPGPAKTTLQPVPRPRNISRQKTPHLTP
jgi:hypothetical protein